MRIAMIGHKEFPSRAGGVEVVVYELATRLTARGVDVTVYNRGKEKHHNRYKELGVNVVRSFTPKNKSLNAMVYSFVATFHALFGKYDIIHYHAIGPCVPLVIAHIFGRKTVATIPALPADTTTMHPVSSHTEENKHKEEEAAHKKKQAHADSTATH